MPQLPSTIVHLDMDSFYVSVERLKDPSLEGKPVAVGGSPDGRGVIASASYEARRFGVRSAMPSSQAVRLCPDLVFVHGDYSGYSTYSRQVRDVLEEFTPLVQMASQDEAYLDLSGTERLWGPPAVAANKIRQAVTSKTHLPCSVGVASRKYIAKISSALCKPKGMLWVPAGSERNFLAPLPVRRMPGVGPKAAERLADVGVKTLGDLQSLTESTVESLLGVHGVELWRRALGEAETEISIGETSKSVSHEVTFERDSLDEEHLASVLSALSEKVASRLRAQGLFASTVVLKYRYAGFETHTANRTLPFPTQDDRVLAQTGMELLRLKRDPARPIRLVGIGGAGLQSDKGQLDLLAEPSDDSRSERMAAALDHIRDKHGFGSIQRASSRDVSRGQWG